MSKKTPKTIDAAAIRRRLAWETNLAELRDGRKQRATTFVDRRKEANRKACRGRITY